MRRENRFKSRVEGLTRRKQCWICLDCGEWHHTKPGKKRGCHWCQSLRVQYFGSKAEANRYQSLSMQLAHGLIEDLELQPAFDIVINEKKVTTYKADFEYTRDGKRIIEDVKGNAGSITDVFKLKKKLVEATFGIKIQIVKGV